MRERIKELKGEKADVPDTPDDQRKRFEEATKRNADWVGVSQMEALARQVTSAIGKSGNEDEEPRLFLDVTELGTEGTEKGDRNKVERSEARRQRRDGSSEELRFCQEACGIYGIDFEACKDLLAEEVLSGRWLGESLSTLQSQSATGGKKQSDQASSWLSELAAGSGKREDALLGHFATEALCSSSVSADSSGAGGRSQKPTKGSKANAAAKGVLNEALLLLKGCLNEREANRASLAMMNALKRVHFLVMKRGIEFDYSKCRKETAQVINLLIRTLETAQGGLVYHLALEVAAHLARQVADDLESLQSIAKVTHAAHARVLRQLATSFRSINGGGDTGRKLIGLHACSALSAFSGIGVSITSDKTLSELEEHVIDQITNKGHLIVTKALQRNLWEFHDLLKALDLFLSQSKSTSWKNSWINFLNEVSKCCKKLEKYSAQQNSVLATELRTTYDLIRTN